MSQYSSAIRTRDGGDRLEIGPGGELDFGSRVHLFDDFLGDQLQDEWDVASGSDAEASDPAINVQTAGVCRLSTGDATGAGTGGSALGHELIWQADQGGLLFECRLKIDTITDVIVNAGFTDVKPSATLEYPFEVGASDALTSTASDGAAFVFDTGAATDNWFAAGVKGDTDAGPTDSGTAPTAGTYQTFRIEIGTDETADFFLDGTQVASLSAAVTKTVALTPVLVAGPDTTAQRNIDIDYVRVEMDR